MSIKKKPHILKPLFTKPIIKSVQPSNKKPQINAETIHSRYVIQYFIENITDLMVIEKSKKSIVFRDGVKNLLDEDFPSIKIPSNYIQSYDKQMDRLNHAVVTHVQNKSFKAFRTTMYNPKLNLSVADLPNDSIWLIHNDDNLSLQIDSVDPKLNDVTTVISHLKIGKSAVRIQLFKYLSKMQSWYLTPYIFEVPLEFIEYRLSGLDIEVLLDVTFKDMCIPADRILIQEIEKIIDLFIYTAFKAKNSQNTLLVPITFTPSAPQIMATHFIPKQYKYYIFQF